MDKTTIIAGGIGLGLIMMLMSKAGNTNKAAGGGQAVAMAAINASASNAPALAQIASQNEQMRIASSNSHDADTYDFLSTMAQTMTAENVQTTGMAFDYANHVVDAANTAFVNTTQRIIQGRQADINQYRSETDRTKINNDYNVDMFQAGTAREGVVGGLANEKLSIENQGYYVKKLADNIKLHENHTFKLGNRQLDNEKAKIDIQADQVDNAFISDMVGQGLNFVSQPMQMGGQLASQGMQSASGMGMGMMGSMGGMMGGMGGMMGGGGSQPTGAGQQQGSSDSGGMMSSLSSLLPLLMMFI